jgi:hypothetical protein
VARGAALWIAVPFIAWLVRGRQDQPQPFTEMPGDTSRHELGRPLIMFAVIRAVAIGGAVAIAFGLDLAHGYWLPIAAITAAVLTLMDLPQPSNYRAEGDRVLWALCGVAIGMLVMFLAELLATRTAKAPPGQPADVPAPRKTTAEQDMASKSGHRAEPGMGQAG